MVFLFGALSVFPFTVAISQTAKIVQTETNSSVVKSPRKTIPLDEGWKFQLREDATEPAANSFDDSNWEPVSLPHTWNAFDGEGFTLGKGKEYFRGTGWYRTHLSLPLGAKGKRVLLEFDGANLETKVYVNGKEAGIHIGGFARFRFDVTDLVDFSRDNLLAVRVTNASSDYIPRNGDFTHFGGIYRKVRVLLTEPVHITTLDHASSGVFLTTPNATTNSSEVNVRAEFTNDADKNFSGKVHVIIRDVTGRMITDATAPTTINAKSSNNVRLNLHVDRPHLWNGVADPYCYRATVELVNATGKILDAVEQPLGFRSYVVKPDQGFFLNGQHLELHGVNRHQDRQDKGWAIDTKDISDDFKLLQEIGANALRMCHYQHDQFSYDLCDQDGLAVWAELAFVGKAPETDAGHANAKEQLRELIRQNFNHPSIFFWSIGNETSGKVSDSMGNLCNSLLVELSSIAHAEDPSRLSTYASHHTAEDPRNFHTDIFAVNKYFGWYHDPDYAGFGKWMDDFHAANPGRSIGVSEYGAGAAISQHEQNPPVRIIQARGPWHPEEGESKLLEETWLQIKARPWIWGTFIWNMFDFASDGRSEGDITGRNDKGLVSYDRQTRKDAFYWFQANWTTKPMVHINSKRFFDRSVPKTELRIYSNCNEVEVWLNGVSLGRKAFTDCRFIWPDIELIPGPNRIQTIAYRNNKPVASDACGWNYRADGDPLPNKVVVEQDSKNKSTK